MIKGRYNYANSRNVFYRIAVFFDRKIPRNTPVMTAKATEY